MNDNQPQTADEIRRRMNQIRGELDEEISGVVANAKRLMSWKYYWRQFPKTSVAVTALAGYMLIPQKKEIIAPDAESLEKLSQKHHLVVEKSPKASRGNSVASTIVKLALTTLLRLAVIKGSELYGKHQKQKESGRAPENGRVAT